MIRARGLSKRFRQARALADVDLEVRAGQALVLLGTNGSGRTTLLRILATLLRPSSGEVWIEGIDAVKEPLRARRSIGYAGPVPSLHPQLTVGEHLELAAAACGLDRQPLRRAVSGARSLAEIAADQPIEHLSDGLRQRLALAAALMSRPPVLLVDGDLGGLDPLARTRFLAALSARCRDGAAIVLACNSPQGLEELCSHVALLHEGRLLESRPLDGGFQEPIRTLRNLAAGASAARETP
jgi:ABC-type multidrug transport system ATPase subunit